MLSLKYKYDAMIRTFITPEKEDISITLPKDFIGKQVEIIAFTIEDFDEVSMVKEPPLTHYASQETLAKDWLSNEENEAWQNL